VAHSPEEVTPAQLEAIQRKIEERGILFKVRVVNKELQQRQEATKPAPAQRTNPRKEKGTKYDHRQFIEADKRCVDRRGGVVGSAIRGAGRLACGEQPGSVDILQDPQQGRDTNQEEARLEREQEKHEREQEAKEREDEKHEREQEARERAQEKVERLQELYDNGREDLDEDRYDRAAAKFKQLADMNGPQTDAALYWKAYAENRLGKRTQL